MDDNDDDKRCEDRDGRWNEADKNEQVTNAITKLEDGMIVKIDLFNNEIDSRGIDQYEPILQQNEELSKKAIPNILHHKHCLNQTNKQHHDEFESHKIQKSLQKRQQDEQQSSTTITRRLVQKNGHCNVSNFHVTERKRKYLADLFTTLVDMRWRLHVALYILTFLWSWIFFALLWYSTVSQGSNKLYLKPQTVTKNTYRMCRHMFTQTQTHPFSTNISPIFPPSTHTNNSPIFPPSTHTNKPHKQPTPTTHHPSPIGCVDNVEDFLSALLLSIETQSTIGYGYRVVQSKCAKCFCELN